LPTVMPSPIATSTHGTVLGASPVTSVVTGAM
jgi:hypothetical protein